MGGSGRDRGAVHRIALCGASFPGSKGKFHIEAGALIENLFQHVIVCLGIRRHQEASGGIRRHQKASGGIEELFRA